jgi:hypothetical protein
MDAARGELLCDSRVTAGEMVLWSITTLSALAVSTAPRGPSSTCSTSALDVTLVKMNSAPRAASAGDAQAMAPRSANGCITSARRACTRSA